jgi:hypothetical protein
MGRCSYHQAAKHHGQVSKRLSDMAPMLQSLAAMHNCVPSKKTPFLETWELCMFQQPCT